MEVLELQDFIKDEVTTPRLYFATRMDDRATIIENTKLKKKSVLSQIKDTSNTEPFLVVKNKNEIYIVRNNNKGNLVGDYTTNYLTNSVITNIIFGGGKYGTFPANMKSRLDSSSFIWYYYWFINSDKDLTNITHNTCFQIEEMIKQILNKELTLYRTFPTGEAVTGLRTRLASERLVNMGIGARGINFRR